MYHYWTHHTNELNLLEQGFEVVVAKDATAAPRHPEWGYGYTAALINSRFLAHAVLATDEVVAPMQPAAAAVTGRDLNVATSHSGT